MGDVADLLIVVIDKKHKRSGLDFRHFGADIASDEQALMTGGTSNAEHQPRRISSRVMASHNHNNDSATNIPFMTTRDIQKADQTSTG